MKYALRLLLATLTVGCIRANVINWDALNGDPINVNRPAPPKRPAPPARPLLPIEEEYYPPNVNEVNGWGSPSEEVEVQINTVGDGLAPPNIGPTVVRPFEPRPTPPVFEEPMGPPIAQHQQPQPEPIHNKPKPPHHFEFQVNEPISKLPSKPIGVDVKPLDVVDGIVVPTPKYPTHSRPQVEIFYEI